MRGAPLVLLLSAVLLLPLASAERYTGSLAANGLLVQGPTSVSSNSLLTRIGGDPNSFGLPPAITLSAERIMLEHESRRYAHAVNGNVMYPTSPATAYDAYLSAVVTFDEWQTSGAELVVHTIPGGLLAIGGISGEAAAPAPLTTLAEPVEWRLGAGSGASIDVGDRFEFNIDAGSLVFDGDDFARDVEYQGDFLVYVFGANLHIKHNTGLASFENGHRTRDTALGPDTWHNVTMLRVHGGRLTVDSGTSAVVSYAMDGALAGLGTVLLQGATGHLEETNNGAVGLERQDVNLIGQYELALRGSPDGFLITIVGEFEPVLLSFSAANVNRAGGVSLWWLALAVGLVAAGGAGGAVYLRRRAQVPAAPTQLASTPVEVPEAPHIEPDFAWEELNEEFGIVRAGEKSGVLIVLVPEDRSQRFLQAVVARGLMAEDTGDRIHAAEHTLAVIALEPSPVMMN